MSALRILGAWVLCLSTAAWGARPAKRAAAADSAKRRGSSAWGEVSSVTAQAAYINRGTQEGLAEGQVINLLRGKKKAATCRVAAVADHYARCEGEGLRAGDRFALRRAASTKPVGAAPTFTAAELARQAETVEAYDWSMRHYGGASGFSGAGQTTRVEVQLQHTSFFGAPSGGFGVQQVGIRAYDVDVWRGLRVSADVNVLNFSNRPTTTRTVYQRSPVLLVRQLELGFHRTDLPFTVAVGRTWLPVTPGLLVLDGAQAGWKFGDSLEVGAYGGLLPDAAQLTLTPSQWAAGAFGRLRLLTGEARRLTSVQVGLRAGWAVRNAWGGRAEVGLIASICTSANVDLTTQLEFGFGQTQGLGGIDAARLDINWRPNSALRVLGGVRYRGLALTGLTEVGATLPGQRAVHGDLGGVWEASPALAFAARGGLATDFDSGLTQGRAGPEVLLPRLGGLPLGLTLGYQEELGWLRGRSGYLQLAFNAFKMVRVIGRGNWFQQQAVAEREGLASHEAGASLLVEVTPWRFIRVRAIAMGRIPLALQTPPLGSVNVQLAGTY